MAKKSGSKNGKCTFEGKVMYPSEYLCSEDLRGRDVSLTIDRVFSEDVRIQDGSKEPKWILAFKETKRKMILNRKAHPEAIAALHGSKAELWPGKRITLYPTMVQCFGETVEAIRVRDTIPTHATGDKKPEPEPEVEVEVENGSDEMFS